LLAYIHNQERHSLDAILWEIIWPFRKDQAVPVSRLDRGREEESLESTSRAPREHNETANHHNESMHISFCKLTKGRKDRRLYFEVTTLLLHRFKAG
jgi:hypothetical protein